MADIFFTYAPADTSRAHAIAEALKAYGIDAAWDRTLLPGERYDAVITRRLNEAKAVVVLWSNASIASGLIMDEASMARDAGKLVPVRIDAVESPIGFRQVQAADLAGFPNPASEAGVKRLAEALAQMSNVVVQPKPAPTPPPPAWKGAAAALDDSEPDRLFTKGYWGWTAALGAFCGLLYFLSPEGRSVMEDDVAQRVGVLIGEMLVPLFAFAVTRIQLFWSRRWVGKSGGSYFTVEFLVMLGLSVLVAILNSMSPQDAPNAGGGLMGLTHQLNYSLIAVFLLVPPLIFVVRGILRLVRGKPKPA